MKFVLQGVFLFIGVLLIRGMFGYLRNGEVDWGGSLVYALFFSIAFTGLLWLMREKKTE